MSARQPGFIYAPTQADEAKGVTIRRVIGGERMAILDPFMLLDHASIAAGSDVVGFPRHPHRGIETLSYVLTGEVGHKDSIGNEGTVGPGGSQWMTAGNGIWHEEMLSPGAEGAEMLQLWFSLPKSMKRVKPGYLGAPTETVPEIVDGPATVRVVAGDFKGSAGSFQDIAVKPTVLDVEVSGEGTVEIPTKVGESAFIYVVRGRAKVGLRTVDAPEMIVLTDGDSLTVSAGPEGTRFLFVSAKPLDEPILQYRSFVMNSVEDIAETLELIHNGTFGNGE